MKEVMFALIENVIEKEIVPQLFSRSSVKKVVEGDPKILTAIEAISKEYGVVAKKVATTPSGKYVIVFKPLLK